MEWWERVRQETNWNRVMKILRCGNEEGRRDIFQASGSVAERYTHALRKHTQHKHNTTHSQTNSRHKTRLRYSFLDLHRNVQKDVGYCTYTRYERALTLPHPRHTVFRSPFQREIYHRAHLLNVEWRRNSIASVWGSQGARQPTNTDRHNIQTDTLNIQTGSILVIHNANQNIWRLKMMERSADLPPKNTVIYVLKSM